MTVDADKKGVLSKDYAVKRAKGWGAYSYRVARRSYEVMEAIKQADISGKCRILDVGAADGLMLNKIKPQLPAAECFGVEYSQELLLSSSGVGLHRICADGQKLPFADANFDVIICTAVIEHIPNPELLIKEAFRVLKPGGIMVVTSPDPFWDKVANFFNGNEHHVETFDIKTISRFLKNGGFTVEITKKFMISPVGLPGEIAIENCLRGVGLNFFFLNQLVMGRKCL